MESLEWWIRKGLKGIGRVEWEWSGGMFLVREEWGMGC